MTAGPVPASMWWRGAPSWSPAGQRNPRRPPMDGIVQIVVIVLIVLFVLGYFGRGRFRA
jgi:hypothetical protein